MPSFDSIVCPVDFSDHSRRALRYAIAVASHQRAKLTVLSVAEPLLAEAAAVEYEPTFVQKGTEYELKDFVSSVMPKDAAWAPKPKMVVNVAEAAEGILKTAGDEHARLLVMGTHGLSGFQKMFFGSTTERVLRETTIPVLAVPLSEPEQVSLEASGPVFTLKRSLSAVDFGETSIGAARIGAQLCHTLGIPLLLVHVVVPFHVAPRLRESLEAHDRDRVDTAGKRLDQLAGALRDGAVVEAAVAVGRPAEQIAALAAERDAGLVIMGLRNARGILSPRPGSIAYRVLCLAHAPVLAVPPSSQET